MSKKPEKPVSSDWETYNVETGEYRSGGSTSGGFCLLNLSLMLTAPTALVALIVKGARR